MEEKKNIVKNIYKYSGKNIDSGRNIDSEKNIQIVENIQRWWKKN